MSVFKVWSPDYDDEDDARGFTAHDAEDAAEKWARHEDASSAEYSIVSGTDAAVMVRDVATGEVSEWTVSGETAAHYSARAKEPRP